jgi:protein-tyrosine phosphatase
MTTPIYWIDGPWAGRLAIVTRPRGGDWLEDEIGRWRSGGVNVVISTLTTAEASDFELAQEGELLQAKGVEYLAFPIPDREVPDSMERTEEFVRKLEGHLIQRKGVAIHCRQGIGRSSLLAACTLILGGIDPAQAFERIQTARGCPVPDTPEQMEWVVRFAQRYGLVGKT